MTIWQRFAPVDPQLNLEYNLCITYSVLLSLSSFSLGRPGVDAHAKHEGESECAVLFAQFLVNEGALVTVTADDTIHLWNIRQKTPRIVQSLKFQRER